MNSNIVNGYVWFFNPSNAEATFVRSTSFFEKHLHPVMLVFSGYNAALAEYSPMSTHMSGFL